MELFEWLAATMLAVELRRSAMVYMLVNAAHILAIGLLVGAILPLDLRLAGFFGKVPVEVIGPFLSRSAGIGLALALITGFCLFSVRPAEYAANPAFLAKLGLITFGIFNVLAVHAGQGWRTAVTIGIIRPAVRFSAALSAVIWIATILAGRWVGFL